MANYQDVIGATQDIVGAVESIIGELPSATKKAVAREVAQSITERKAVLVRNREPDKKRRGCFGVSSSTIAASATVVISVSPQVLFRPERFVIPDSVSQNVTISDIRIGKNPQFASQTGMPGATFSHLAVGTAVEFDTMQPQQDVTITVTNNTTGSVNFSAGFLGTYVE